MVESRLELFSNVVLSTENQFSTMNEGSSFGSPRTSSSSCEPYERADLPTPTVIHKKPRRHSSGGSSNLPKFLQPDARGEMPEDSVPDLSNTGSNRRKSHSQLGNVRRSFEQRAPSPNRAYPISSSPSLSESVYSLPLQGASISYAPTNMPYSHQPGFFGQYAMPTQPGAMAMASPTYTYSHYAHPVLSESNMITHNMHPSYASMSQPHPGPVFPFQPEGGFSTHPSLSSMQTAPMYPLHQAPSPTSPHIPTPPGSNNALSPSHFGSGPFHYPSPLPNNPFPNTPQTFTSPRYQSQYHQPPYGQHYTTSGEAEPWYPHGSVSPSGTAFQGRFSTVPYSRLGRLEHDTASRGQANAPSPTYPGAPGGRTISKSQAATDSPGTGPKIQSPLPLAGTPPNYGRPAEKPILRRSYHPNPPPHRSEWVMWAGNVPSDATHDELWRFFNQPPPDLDSVGATGVLSIFLISRSSCAFVNYESDYHLQEAIVRFNGIPLRPNDALCPRLVCRVRRIDDDLKAGVGGQRGMGMHTKWIKDRKGKRREMVTASADISSSTMSVSERIAAVISTVSISSDEHGDEPNVHTKQPSSSGSFSSTNSSFLARYFPRRYFILKSLTQYDLDLSVETGLWATQRHNEEILDQAFRTSREVYLIFGVNKSGEFYGYATMSGPVRRGEKHVDWASRSSQSSVSRSSDSPLVGLASKADTFFSPNDLRLVDNSPLPAEDATSDREGLFRHSAPALLGDPYRLPTASPFKGTSSLDQGMSTVAARKGFHLDAGAPQRAMRQNEASVFPQSKSGSSKTPLQSVEETEEKEQKVEEASHQPDESNTADAWGDSFAVEWISTVRLPFHRTRHLRNPWNHDREIKVSRDGTELEPSVGERLLDEWEKLAKEPQSQTTPLSGPERAHGKRSVVPRSAGAVDASVEDLEDEEKGRA